ncbi:endonuclease domain-containing protein [Actinacidiphila glaucinigra]
MVLSGINSCRHREYFMSCEQLDRLLERSGGCCEICRRPGIETSHGQLYIDHDKWRGMWAVRGLLCGRCNSMLQHEQEFDDEVGRYLERSWFWGMLADLGVQDDPAEPPVGTTVSAGQACNWIRSADGWRCPCGRHRRTRIIPRSWDEILRAFGPHRIRVHGASAPP